MLNFGIFENHFGCQNAQITKLRSNCESWQNPPDKPTKQTHQTNPPNKPTKQTHQTKNSLDFILPIFYN
jgi:hypothetical protein